MPARQGSDVRAAAECPNLAQLHQHVLEPAAAQEIGDAVGDVALRHAVQRHRHAGPAKADPGRVELDRAPVDPCQGGGERRLARAGRIGGRVGEVPGVEIPERLDGDVEGTAGRRGDARCEGQQRDQLERWVV